MQILRFPLAAPRAVPDCRAAGGREPAGRHGRGRRRKPGAAGHADHAPTEKGPGRRPDPRRRQRRRTAGQRIRRFLTPAPVGLRRLKPVATGEIKARVRVLRPNGVVEELRLEPSDGALVSTGHRRTALFRDRSRGELARPGRSAQGVAGKDEGLIALTAEQVAAAGIRSAAAAPAALEATSQFPGEIKFNADRTARIVPRLAGVAQEAPSSWARWSRRATCWPRCPARPCPTCAANGWPP